MVASANPLSSKIGFEILKKGGNAIDAAVATAFALGVAEPFASGIGGGGFMLIYWEKRNEVLSLDYRETAPLHATQQAYEGPDGHFVEDKVLEGQLSVAVPGTLAGLTEALRKYGTMDLKTVLEPSIELAEKGYPVSRLLNEMMESNLQKISKFPETARIYSKQGRPYKIGDHITLGDLAETYRLIAEKGPEVFYRGAIAEAIEREMKSTKGLITREDLAAYHPVWRQPVHGSYRGYEIFSMGPPSSGGTHVIELLNILEGYDMARLGLNTSQSIYLMSQALKSVFADREKFMGDPDFEKIPLQELLSKEHAGKLRKALAIRNLNPKPTAENLPVKESPQTTHLSVVDGEGNLVALTQTLNSFFGSGVVVPGTGVLLNNEMFDFAPRSGTPNSLEPGKRPVSSMSPTVLLKDGKPFLTIGMPGATRIISVLPQILINIIDHQMSLQKAIDAPRIHCITNREIFIESRIPEDVRNALIRQGCQLTVKKDFDLYFGGAQGILIDPKTGKLHGGADPRREGSVMGF